jgi:phosphopantetheinyl transferase
VRLPQQHLNSTLSSTRKRQRNYRRRTRRREHYCKHRSTLFLLLHLMLMLLLSLNRRPPHLGRQQRKRCLQLENHRRLLLFSPIRL